MALYRCALSGAPDAALDHHRPLPVPVLLNRAIKIRASHRATPDGWCEGCINEGITTFYPCPLAAWAAQISDEHRNTVDRCLDGGP